jgi:Amt family ammonium transporter
MQAGFAFLEAGAVRSKNTTNILIKNLLNSSTYKMCYRNFLTKNFFRKFAGICAIFYWATGWAFAFGPREWWGRPFCGLSEFFAGYAAPERFSTWFFQYSFAATSSTIVSGGVAERIEVIAYFAYSAVYTGEGIYEI